MSTEMNNPVHAAENLPKPTKRNNTLIIVIVVLVVLCCCCISIASLFYIFGDNLMNLIPGLYPILQNLGLY